MSEPQTGAVLLEIVRRFAADGYVLLKGFYNVKQEIEPVQQGIRSIIELVAGKYGVDAPCGTPEEAMVSGQMALVAGSRKYGAEVYDAVKQLPAFLALVANNKNIQLFNQLRAGAMAGIAAGGSGIRIDNPREEKFMAPWHQEFPAQLRSQDGAVFWSPLLPVSPELGPVELCVGSHREGPVPVYEDDGGIGKSGAYGLRLDREEERLAKYERVAPLTEPGDLLIMDFLTLHRSGYNSASHPRWSMQFRYFNFADPVGVKIAWRGSFAAGERYQDVLPDLVAARG